MEYSKEYDGDYNYITVKEWSGKKVDGETDYTIAPDNDEYYYMVEVYLDDNDGFDSVGVKKVGGGQEDSARGGEWYEELNDEEIEWILDDISWNCFNEGCE